MTLLTAGSLTLSDDTVCLILVAIDGVVDVFREKDRLKAGKPRNQGHSRACMKIAAKSPQRMIASSAGGAWQNENGET